MSDPRRELPSMDALLAEPEARAWGERVGRETVKRALRHALEEARRTGGPHGTEPLWRRASEELDRLARPSLRRVLNGTGVVLHTNLGRAPLAAEAVEAQRRAAAYGNVEFSLDRGERSSRYHHCASLVCELTGAEGALVTNNNAAAVSLVVNELAGGREVVVSRGELVEIGGSFRIPDVVARSGARLREVGTTNRTRARDYAEAVSGDTGLLLRVHPSNYRVEGFAGRPDLEEIVAVGAEADVPLAHDVGSGLLDADLLPGFPPEPAVRDSIAAGADLVTWSGDKLLGGPQAGLIAGRAELIDRLRRSPLLRAFRVDKTTLAALEATLMLHRDPETARRRIPALRMLTESLDAVEKRAAGALERAMTGHGVPVELSSLRAVVGGGAFPGFELDSAGWVVRAPSAEALARACCESDPPLVGRIEKGVFVVDARTLEAEEIDAAAEVLARAAAGLETA